MLTNLSHLSHSGEFNHVFMISENMENTNSTDTAGGDRDKGAGADGGEPAELFPGVPRWPAETKVGTRVSFLHCPLFIIAPIG